MADYQTFKNLIQALLNSEDDTGCSGDITVVSKSATEALRDALAASTPDTWSVALHDHNSYVVFEMSGIPADGPREATRRAVLAWNSRHPAKLIEADDDGDLLGTADVFVWLDGSVIEHPLTPDTFIAWGQN